VADAEVVGIYSRREERAKEVAERWGIANYYTDWKEAILKSGADVVDICLRISCIARRFVLPRRTGCM
jgi:predicted dehydrogenase